MKPEAKEIGKKIREEREKLGLSVEELASRIKISKNQVDNIEAGKSIPLATALAKISRVLGKPIDFFLEHIESYFDRVNYLFDNEVIKKGLLVKLGLVAAGPVKLDFKTKEAILKQLGILKEDKKSKK